MEVSQGSMLNFPIGSPPATIADNPMAVSYTHDGYFDHAWQLVVYPNGDKF
jgi:hypothetical protein